MKQRISDKHLESIISVLESYLNGVGGYHLNKEDTNYKLALDLRDARNFIKEKLNERPDYNY